MAIFNVSKSHDCLANKLHTAHVINSPTYLLYHEVAVKDEQHYNILCIV